MAFHTEDGSVNVTHEVDNAPILPRNEPGARAFALPVGQNREKRAALRRQSNRRPSEPLAGPLERRPRDQSDRLNSEGDTLPGVVLGACGGRPVCALARPCISLR